MAASSSKSFSRGGTARSGSSLPSSNSPTPSSSLRASSSPSRQTASSSRSQPLPSSSSSSRFCLPFSTRDPRAWVEHHLAIRDDGVPLPLSPLWFMHVIRPRVLVERHFSWCDSPPRSSQCKAPPPERGSLPQPFSSLTLGCMQLKACWNVLILCF